MKNVQFIFLALGSFLTFTFGLCPKAADIIQVSDKRSFDYTLQVAPAGDANFTKTYNNNLDSVLQKNGLSGTANIQSITLNTLKLTLDDASKISFDDVTAADLKINGDAIATIPAKGSANRSAKSIVLTDQTTDITKYVNAAQITFQLHLTTTAANTTPTPLHVFVDYTVNVK